MRDTALHDCGLINVIVVTGSFFIRYTDGHTKQTYRQLKTFRDYF